LGWSARTDIVEKFWRLRRLLYDRRSELLLDLCACSHLSGVDRDITFRVHVLDRTRFIITNVRYGPQ
jgi:hypothetical protein